MDVALLRNLGVNEAIIQALEKSYGEEYEELEIMQDRLDLKLFLRRTSLIHAKPHILTLPNFFKRSFLTQQLQPDAPSGPHLYYNCSDTLEFLPENASQKTNLKINGAGMWLSGSLLRLLLYLAQKVVDTAPGWVYIQDMKSEGVVHADGYQSFSRLRGAVAGYLIKRNAREFIEANGRKQYRLSVDPKNIRLLKG